MDLLDSLELTAETTLLDVGSGVGGPARHAAARHGCPVTGIDLSPDLVRVSRTLTDRVMANNRADALAGLLSPVLIVAVAA